MDTGHGRPETDTKDSQTLLADLMNFHQSMKRKYPKGTGDSSEILRQIRQERALVFTNRPTEFFPS